MMPFEMQLQYFGTIILVGVMGVLFIDILDKRTTPGFVSRRELKRLKKLGGNPKH